MLNKIKNLVSEEKGQGMTEYGLLLAVVVVVVVGALTIFSSSLKTLFDNIKTALDTAIESIDFTS